MSYKKQFKKKDSAPYQDHLYEPNTYLNKKSDKIFLKEMQKEGSQFNVITGFATLFLIGAVIGLVLFDSKFNKSSVPAE